MTIAIDVACPIETSSHNSIWSMRMAPSRSWGFVLFHISNPDAGVLPTQWGTPYYCAPEIINDAEETSFGVKIDAWSCGIILYRLLPVNCHFKMKTCSS
jgi:serine/threonine protein kinase